MHCPVTVLCRVSVRVRHWHFIAQACDWHVLRLPSKSFDLVAAYLSSHLECLRILTLCAGHFLSTHMPCACPVRLVDSVAVCLCGDLETLRKYNAPIPLCLFVVVALLFGICSPWQWQRGTPTFDMTSSNCACITTSRSLLHAAGLHRRRTALWLNRDLSVHVCVMVLGIVQYVCCPLCIAPHVCWSWSVVCGDSKRMFGFWSDQHNTNIKLCGLQIWVEVTKHRLSLPGKSWSTGRVITLFGRIILMKARSSEAAMLSYSIADRTPERNVSGFVYQMDVRIMFHACSQQKAHKWTTHVVLDFQVRVQACMQWLYEVVTKPLSVVVS